MKRSRELSSGKAHWVSFGDLLPMRVQCISSPAGRDYMEGAQWELCEVGVRGAWEGRAVERRALEGVVIVRG